MDLSIIPYERPLVIGTGGGNDIVSATLVLYDIINAGKRPDLAGMLSPAAIHFYDDSEERNINLVTDRFERYLQMKKPIEKSFIDSKIPGLLHSQAIDSKVYDLSCRFGTTRLLECLDSLIRVKGYDGIVAVDVGGDILARGKKDPTILSPLMDFTTLYVISQLNVPSTLIEFGLETDGELRPGGCEEILKDLQDKKIIDQTLTISKNDYSVKFMKNIYDRIKHLRTGNTVERTLKTLRENQDINTFHKIRMRVLDKTITDTLPITLEQKFFGKVYMINLKKLAKNRVLAFPYENNLEQVMKTKEIVDVSTEMDLLYYNDNETYVWIGTPNPSFKGDLRNQALKYGLDNLEQHADLALIWKKDKKSIPNNLDSIEISKFLLVGKNKRKLSQIESLIKGFY